jgi:hypothetical protein
MIRRTLITLCAFALIAATAAFVHAQTDSETKAIQSYRLTLPVLQKITAANRAFVAALKNDPAAQKQLEAEDDKNDDDQQSLAAMEKKLVAMPHMSDALRSAGLSAHEYAMFEMCALQAGLVAGSEKNGLKVTNLPTGMQPANVQFVTDHEKEMKEMNGALQGQ